MYSHWLSAFKHNKQNKTINDTWARLRRRLRSLRRRDRAEKIRRVPCDCPSTCALTNRAVIVSFFFFFFFFSTSERNDQTNIVCMTDKRDKTVVVLPIGMHAADDAKRFTLGERYDAALPARVEVCDRSNSEELQRFCLCCVWLFVVSLFLSNRSIHDTARHDEYSVVRDKMRYFEFRSRREGSGRLRGWRIGILVDLDDFRCRKPANLAFVLLRRAREAEKNAETGIGATR
jgi:hypothetical protein